MHLDNLLSRNSRIVNSKRKSYIDPWAKDVYTKEELNELEINQNFAKEVARYHDYYQWKNFKLPINSFANQIFLNKYGIDLLKHNNTIK